MQQITLARQAEFQRFGKKTRREQFLDEMEAGVPWSELQALVAPHYSKGETGRKPVGLSILLRVYFLQQWFALSDPGVEDALYESPVLRRFAGIDLGRAPAPDETTNLNFRHLLEAQDLCGRCWTRSTYILPAAAFASRRARSRTRRLSRCRQISAAVLHNLALFRRFLRDSLWLLLPRGR